jgi:hypothetical protein
VLTGLEPVGDLPELLGDGSGDGFLIFCRTDSELVGPRSSRVQELRLGAKRHIALDASANRQSASNLTPSDEFRDDSITDITWVSFLCVLA